MFHKGSDCLLVVPAFGRIDDIICLNQNLIVNAVDLRRAMVVPYQIGHTVDLFCCHAGIRQELPHQRGTLLLLIFTIGVAVLFAAERAGDIVGDGRHLQNKLRVCVQPLQLTNGFGIGPHAAQVRDVMDIPFGKGDHLFHDLCNGHHLFSLPFLMLKCSP